MNEVVEIRITDGLPDPDIFRELRRDVGWGEISDAQAMAALAGSQFGVVAEVDGETVGFARVTGDGALSLYIEDVIVKDEFRGGGVGAAMVRRLVDKIETKVAPGAMIALLAAEDREEFYERLGFERRPSPGYGAAMMRVVGGETLH